MGINNIILGRCFYLDLIYLDCYSGISGDMLISALIELGFPFPALQELVARLNLEISLATDSITVQGIRARHFSVLDGAPQFRNFGSIEQMFHKVDLPADLIAAALHILRSIAGAEAAVHGMAVDDIHFHEIGAADTIVDVLGTLYALQYLGVKTVYSSPLPWSSGLIAMDHGLYPGPAPATALLLTGMPCRGVDVEMELITPTGAALLKGLDPVFSPLPLCKPQKIGYGAGSRLRSDSVPNLLRIIGANRSNFPEIEKQEVAVLECQVDDMNPEAVAFLFDLLLDHPMVHDVYTTPVGMKKGRSGILLSVLCQPSAVSEISALIINHSTTLGVRFTLQDRIILKRREIIVTTAWGDVGIKIAILPDGRQRIKPEYAHCRAIAIKHGLTLQQVYQEVMRLADFQIPHTVHS